MQVALALSDFLAAFPVSVLGQQGFKHLLLVVCIVMVDEFLDILGLDEVNAVFEIARVEMLLDQAVVEHILLNSRILN